MTVDIRLIRYKLTCPRHSHYNPENGGEGAIRGGCEVCTDIYRLWKAAIALDEQAHKLSEKIIATRKADRDDG